MPNQGCTCATSCSSVWKAGGPAAECGIGRDAVLVGEVLLRRPDPDHADDNIFMFCRDHLCLNGLDPLYLCLLIHLAFEFNYTSS